MKQSYNQGQRYLTHLFKTVAFITTKSMLSEVIERIDVPKDNIDIGGRGWGYTGEGDRYVYYAKRAILRKCLNTFVPHCSYLPYCHVCFNVLIPGVMKTGLANIL